METWIQAHTANLKAGDVVRVKDNSYRGSLADVHNGRICEVIQVRSGDVIVKSIDGKLPTLAMTYHSPNILEKKVVD